MNRTQTLARALDILFILAEEGTSLSVSEISEKVLIPESTTYRLLQTLEKNGVIARKEKGRISLGLRILELSRVLHQQIDRELHLIAKPIMEKLTEEIEETSILTVRTGMKVICVQQVESKRLIRLAIQNGRTLPLHQGASGKSILAFENPAIIKKVFNMIEDSQDRDELSEELERVRQKGYSKTVGEVDEDVFGIAAPIYDNYNRVIASLTIAGPENRIHGDSIQSIIEATIHASQEITENFHQLTEPDF